MLRRHRATNGLLILLTLCAGLRVSASDAGRQEPRGAVPPVTVVVFSDFECPYCARLAPELRRLMAEAPGRVQVMFKHLPLPMHQRAPLAHRASLAAGAQGRFWEMHDLLFEAQGRLDEATFLQHAKTLGLDVDQFAAARRGDDAARLISDDVALASALGVTATPTLFVNGRRLSGVQSYASLKALVERPGMATTAANAALAPVEIDLGTAPTLGSADAPVTFVIFSDFQCPFCARVVPTLNELRRRHGDQIRFVFKHYPLPMHPAAPLAHHAASAAAEQGKFWEMHDRIFANQKAMTRADLLRHARDLALDMTRFEADLEDKTLAARIDGDLAQGQALDVSGTPTMFINGREISGAQPIERFEQLIASALGKPLPTVAAESAASAEAPAPAPPAAPPLPAFNPAVARGAGDAPVTIEWFSDLGSPMTRKADALIRDLERLYPNQLRIVFRHKPLDNQPERLLLHYAADAAAAAGKFWSMHDRIVAARSLPTRDGLRQMAIDLDIPADAIQAALDGRSARVTFDDDVEAARRRDIRGTPTFFINKRRVDGLQSLDFLKPVIDAELQATGTAAKSRFD